MWVETLPTTKLSVATSDPRIHTLLFRRHVASIVKLTSEGSNVTIEDNGANIREQWRRTQAFGPVSIFLYFASITGQRRERKSDSNKRGKQAEKKK
jgi:hypothetical protein